MVTKAANIGLCWDLADTASVDASQQWVLTAMQQHGPGLLTLLWRILGNEQDVCDAYQETFLHLAHRPPDEAQPKNIKAYLFRSASNVAISQLRRKKIQAQAFQNLTRTAPLNRHPDYGAELDAKHLQQTLRSHIVLLPEHLRSVIVLHDLAELSYKQTAIILNISEASARVYRCRAINWLADRMADRKEK
jgi:RNA polymerase sigma-70 factor (ECF subfamily)